MKSIELLIILMALNSSSATASHDNQARADRNPQPPAKTAPAKVATRTAPAGRNAAGNPATGAKNAQSSLLPGARLAGPPRILSGPVESPFQREYRYLN